FSILERTDSLLEQVRATGLSEGTAVIRATDVSNPEVYCEIKVTVKNEIPDITDIRYMTIAPINGASADGTLPSATTYDPEKGKEFRLSFGYINKPADISKLSEEDLPFPVIDGMMGYDTFDNDCVIDKTGTIKYSYAGQEYTFNLIDREEDNPATPANPDTGDHTDMMLYGGIGIIALVGVFTVILFRRKHA
ncbi:MAG: LPXTG cell wall anchor domain-containing protein, partial [Bulleidia sp.]